MKWALVALYGFVQLVQSNNDIWRPIDALSLACAYPCRNTRDIRIWVERGLPPDNITRYYVHINKAIPAYREIKVTFDSEVRITITVKSDKNKYSKISLREGDVFPLRFPERLAELSFLVERVQPGPTPHLTGLTLGDEEYCQPDMEFLRVYAAETENVPQHYNNQWFIERSKVTKCGKRRNGHHVVTVDDGPAEPGDWPWHAAVYIKGRYVCGATLVSDTFLITAAHCVLSKRGRPLAVDLVKVVLGKHNFKVNETDSEELKVQTVIAHEEYNATSFFNDIALLQLGAPVTFSNYILPACLPPRNPSGTRDPSIDAYKGAVAGWGYNNEDAFPEELHQVLLPVVDQVTCYNSYPEHYSQYLHVNSFCAGYLNKGTSVCNGDAGGGYMIYDNEIDSWRIRGVLSTQLAVRGRSQCDADQFSVYTDVARFADWLDSRMR